MNENKAKYRIEGLRNRYLQIRLLEILLLAIASIFFILGISYLLGTSTNTKIVASSLAALAILAERVFRYKLIEVTKNTIAQHLNAHYPVLEESADLLLLDSSSLSSLQIIQQQKVGEKFDSIYMGIKIPNLLPQSAIVLILCMGSYFLLTSFASPIASFDNENFNNLAPALTGKKQSIPIINFLSVTISPPLYTSLKSFISASPDLKVAEGSNVNWSIKFSSEIEHAQLLFFGKDSMPLYRTEKEYSISRTLNESSFYQIQWRDKQKTNRSDYFKIEIIKDDSPKLTIDNLNQFTQYPFAKDLKVQVKSTLQDDYGLAGSTIIATVSKGSGESVKFREEKLLFDTPKFITGKKVKASATLDLLALGMEAGDELYFYVEAFDNRTPIPNYSRTETFFISIKDTVKQMAVEDEGLGVDLMPEYFRSQRQIIIDTEKLLREKKKMALQQFKFTSNELGYDQKVLRLRYGQFLGEEFEGQIGKASVEEDHHDHESTIEKFGHAHDKENEHNLVADKKVDPTAHQHTEQPKDTEAKENPLEAFAHNHDDGEQATFFVQSVRAKLKAALAVMWDAELYLRLFEPAKSLPYQYTALKLLKEISNDSRIYVHRTGFDPPPLKEERRLSGDLAEIRSPTVMSKKLSEQSFPEIRRALVLLDYLTRQDVSTMNAKDKNQLHLAGQELASIALQVPGKYLGVLTLLKKIEENQLDKTSLQFGLRSVQKAFWEIVPAQPVSPSKSAATAHDLDQQFLNSFLDGRHD